MSTLPENPVTPATPDGSCQPLPELVSFLEGMNEPHILFDPQYRILAANAAYRRQFSPERSVLGRTSSSGDKGFIARSTLVLATCTASKPW